MAHGPYTTPPNTIGEQKLDGLLSHYNAGISAGELNASFAEQEINLRLFNDSLFTQIPYLNDSTAAPVTMTTALLVEYGNTVSDTMDYTSNSRGVVLLGASNVMNFDDLGSTTDKGDIIVGSDVNQFIEVNQGKNYVVAGNAHSTLVGGSGADTLVGGGFTSIEAGSGAQSLVGGTTKISSDTLVGGTGADTLTALHGDNLLVAGSGTDSIYSSDKGVGSGQGGDSISLTAGGNANVVIGGGAATDSVIFGGTVGNDSITTSGNVDVVVQGAEVLSSIDTKGTTTTLSFKDGQTLTYSGSGHVTVNFNS